MAYATPADLINYKNANHLGDLCTDSGTRVAAGDLPLDPKILAALDAASGEIDAALLQGKRYTVEDLAALEGGSLAYLKKLTCDIAFWILWDRKPAYRPDDHSRDRAIEMNQQALKLLRTGEHIFNVTAIRDAGVPKLEYPSIVEMQQNNYVVDAARPRYYPSRRASN
jgi:phage gp36-like protein